MLKQTFAGAFRDAGARPNSTEETEWTCQLCATRVNITSEKGDTSQCPCCSRPRFPSWLTVASSGMQLCLGSQVSLRETVWSKGIGVITGIDFRLRQLELVVVSSGLTVNTSSPTPRVSNSAGSRRSRFKFYELELSGDEVQLLVPVCEEEGELQHVLEQHGLCGSCRRVFQLRLELPESREAHLKSFREISDDFGRCSELKQLLIREKKFDGVLECTDKLKAFQTQLGVSRRRLEVLDPISCPYCGWNVR